MDNFMLTIAVVIAGCGSGAALIAVAAALYRRTRF